MVARERAHLIIQVHRPGRIPLLLWRKEILARISIRSLACKEEFGREVVNLKAETNSGFRVATKGKTMPLIEDVISEVTEDSVGTKGTVTSVSASTAAVDILAQNPARIGCSVFNDANSKCILLCSGDGEVSADNFTVAVRPGGYFECPFGYQGRIRGFWLGSTGAARVTEFT